MADKIEHRPLSVIAREIAEDWRKPYFGAVPYIGAMSELTHISDKYMADSAQSIVLYFLSNAGHWKGKTAREIKQELKGIVRQHRATVRGDTSPNDPSNKQNGGGW